MHFIGKKFKIKSLSNESSLQALQGLFEQKYRKLNFMKFYYNLKYFFFYSYIFKMRIFMMISQNIITI